MLSTIESINSVINNFIWGLPAMICIIGVGIVLSIRTRFIQIRKFPYAMKITIGRMLKKRIASDGALTPFQAVCTALAATVGTGNIAGVAGAIAIGGPGAVFWMWISAILGMCTKFSEVVLAVHFKETNDKGELVGWCLRHHQYDQGPSGGRGPAQRRRRGGQQRLRPPVRLPLTGGCGRQVPPRGCAGGALHH